MRMRRVLAATSPEQQEVQRDLAIAYEKLGNVQLASGRAGAAESSYRGALSEFERLAKADPSNVVAMRSVAISREKVAGTLTTQGRVKDAVALLETALSTHARLAAGDPENAQARCDTARLQEAIGDALTLAAASSASLFVVGHTRDRQELSEHEGDRTSGPCDLMRRRKRAVLGGH